MRHSPVVGPYVLLLLGCGGTVLRTGDSEDGGSDADASSEEFVACEDGGGDGEGSESLEDGFAEDGDFGEASDTDGADCSPAVPPDFVCSGDYVARRSPIDTTGWRPMSGYGGVQRVADGWAWVGIVRESGGGPRIVGYHFVRADEHFTELDASAVAENLPLLADGVEWGLGFAGHLKCADRWLMVLDSPDRPGETYLALYASDGRALEAPQHITSVHAGGAVVADDATESFLFLDAEASDCARQLAPVRVSASDLLVTRGARVSFDGYQTVAAFWRSDAYWILRGQDACSPAAPRLVLWDLHADGTSSTARSVTGLPDLTGVWTDWSVGFPPWGVGAASAITMLGSVAELLYAPVDPDTAAALSPAVTIVRMTDAGEVRGLALEPEGDWGWGMLYQQTSGSDGTQRVFFARFTRAGEVVQRTLLSESPAFPGAGGFLLRWMGERYIVGYHDGADLIDEFICSLP
jgi:hypothetical protein